MADTLGELGPKGVALYLSANHGRHPDAPGPKANVDEVKQVFDAIWNAVGVALEVGAKTGDGYMMTLGSVMLCMRVAIQGAKDETAFALLFSKLIERQTNAFAWGYYERALGVKPKAVST